MLQFIYKTALFLDAFPVLRLAGGKIRLALFGFGYLFVEVKYIVVIYGYVGRSGRAFGLKLRDLVAVFLGSGGALAALCREIRNFAVAL